MHILAECLLTVGGYIHIRFKFFLRHVVKCVCRDFLHPKFFVLKFGKLSSETVVGSLFFSVPRSGRPGLLERLVA